MALGRVTVELTSADLLGLLKRISDAGIILQDVSPITGLTVRSVLDRADLSVLRNICRSSGADIRVLRSAGILRILRQLWKRPILVGGLSLLFLLTLYLPSRILFVEIEGATTIPPMMILSNAEQCGIGFWADRSEIRSEKVKNALLETMPELQWVGINTYGCRAVISVRERTQIEEELPQQGISSLVAIRDGVITELTVLNGNPICRVGQSVMKGQVLISGYTDLGICIHGTVAEGEVYGQTQRTLEVIAPSDSVQKTAQTRRDKKISLIFGKNRINFFKGSGISGASCDKMYSYHYVTLPGGFRLPVAFVVEETIWYEEGPSTVDASEAAERLSACADGYLRSQMIAGRIDNRYEIVTPMEGAYYQIGKYVCCELISRPRPEEDLRNDEAD